MDSDENKSSSGEDEDFGYTQQLKNRVRLKLAEVLKKYNREDLLEMTYSISAELIINAAKAMMKRIIFAENKLDLNSYEDWEKGTSIFKTKLNEKCFQISIKN